MQQTTRLQALCCECGDLRWVDRRYACRFETADVNRAGDHGSDPRGWRMTRTLKCSTCMTKTRHALIRADDDSRDRDAAEVTDHEPRRTVVRPRVANDDGSGYLIVDRLQSAKAVREGRHPGVSRYLAAFDAAGREIATAFEYPDYWHIDVEYHAITLAGMDWNNRIFGGFRVKSEEVAYDWLRLFAALAVTR